LKDTEESMAEEDKGGIDRRTFLKSAGAGAALATSATVMAQSPEAAKQEAQSGKGFRSLRFLLCGFA